MYANTPTVRLHKETGSTLLFAVASLAILALLATEVLQIVTPRYHSTHQTAGWQEARLAAEAGIDAALNALRSNLPDPTTGTNWPGWKQMSGESAVAASGSTLARSNSNALVAGNALLTSPTVFLDNLDVSPAAGIPAQVDVQLYALYPDSTTKNCWFGIRSMGTSGLSGPRRANGDSADNLLRKLNLVNIRAQLQADDLGTPMTIPTPNSSRIVEVLVKPYYLFENAITTENEIVLGHSANWRVDSYDSSDPNKSGPNGSYPDGDDSKIQSNGHIGSNKQRPSDSPYGPIIDANGAVVRGRVTTNGGDDPSTPEHENIADAGGIDPNRISDDFSRVLPPVVRPVPGVMVSNPVSGEPFTPGSENNPNFYLISGKLGAFSVSPAPAGTRGALTIFVNGDLDLGNGSNNGIVIPPNVTAKIYVKGNINFSNGEVNAGDGSGKIPSQLQIYGEGNDSDPRTVISSGNPKIAAVFYGPLYDVLLKDNSHFYGSIISKSFALRSGGGNGGFHYDEALSELGDPIGFRVVSYFEDSRR